jgi:hypothetical protein
LTLGAVGGALVGASARLLYEGDKAELVQIASRELATGKAVVAAEIGEYDLTEFQLAMERIGAIVLRK